MQEKKAKVGLLGLMLQLYDRYPEIKPAMVEFANELKGTMSPYADVLFPGVCNTRQLVNDAIDNFEKQKVDLLMVVLLTYAPSHIALSALCKTKLPILIYNTQQAFSITQDSPSDVTFKNHGMHGVQDLANVLLRAGCPFRILTGHYKDEKILNELKAWCDSARVANFMQNVRIGLMGYPMEQMGDFAIDETAFLSQMGVEVQRIPMKLVAERAENAPSDEIAKQIAYDHKNFEVDPNVNADAHSASSRLEWAIRSVLKEQGMHGFSAHFMAVAEDGRIETLPFLASSKLLAEGYGYGGEGDVTSSAAVVMMSELAGSANFTEMFTMDFGGNAVLMSHMGEANPNFARKDMPVQLVMDDLGIADMKYPPVLLRFSLEPGDVTLASLTTLAEGKIKLIVAEGKVLDFPPIPTINKPHFKFAPADNLCDFLTKFSMEGGSHHQALVYGSMADKVKKVAEILGVDCAIVCKNP
jgi:L-arabinose isomerase